eukprot:scaffold370_cov176-Amphora_coffeaeformis.AAC.19
MDSSQRSMDSSQGSQQGQQRSSPLRTSPSRPSTGAALARPPTFGSVGGSPGGMPGPPPGLMPNQRGYGYTGQPLPAQPGQQQQAQQNQQRLLQMQRQQQLRQLHAQQRHPTSQQTQNLSQLQQNYMQHLAADSLGNSQRSTGSSTSAASANLSGVDHNNQHNSHIVSQQGPSPSVPNGLPYPNPPSLMMSQANNQSAMNNMNRTNSHSSSMNMNFMPPAPVMDQGRNPQLQQQPQKDFPTGQSQTMNPVPPLRPGMASNVAGGTLHPNMPPPSNTTTTTSHANGNIKTLNASTTTTTLSQGPAPPPLPHVDEKQIPGLLAKCDFKDKTLWVSRQLLGGQALNKFLGSTANVQRIKRQRVRQLKTKDTTPSQKGKTDDGASVNSNPSLTGSAAAKKREGPPLEDEQEVKLQVMNSRTAKKIKSEMEVGLKFCGLMHETIRGILKELDVPGIAIPAPLGPELPAVPADKMPSLLRNANAPKSTIPIPKPPVVAKQTSRAAYTTSVPTTAAPAPMPVPPIVQPPPPIMTSPQSATAAGSAKNSTLRRTRRKKLPPSNSLNVGLSEFDSTGKRLLSKKDFSQRIFEVVRFRTLRQGDHVAARLSSRDLWILARVTNDYPAVSMPAVEFLQLSAVRRDALFREKVILQDVEDKDSGPNAVSRSLVLPLPRNYSEAAEWGQHYRKGSRVYAMYPETTSLYTGTVFDNTTYCQGDDDIIVVEFDGDEPDHTGSPPKCHIPARFVTLIPREFPSFQDKPARRQTAAPAAQAGGATGRGFAGFADPLNNLDLTLDNMESFDGFDDLDFDLGLGN